MEQNALRISPRSFQAADILMCVACHDSTLAIEGAASPESKEDASPTALFEDPWMVVACRGDLFSLHSVMQSA